MTIPMAFGPRKGPVRLIEGHKHYRSMDWQGEVAVGNFREFDFKDKVKPEEFAITGPLTDVTFIDVGATPDGTTTAMRIYRPWDGTTWATLSYDMPLGGTVRFYHSWDCRESPNSEGDDALFSINGSLKLRVTNTGGWTERIYTIDPKLDGPVTMAWGFYQYDPDYGGGAATWPYHRITDIVITKSTGVYAAGSVVRQGNKLWIAVKEGVISQAGTADDWELVAHAPRTTTGETLPSIANRFEGDQHYLKGATPGLHMLIDGAWVLV